MSIGENINNPNPEAWNMDDAPKLRQSPERRQSDHEKEPTEKSEEEKSEEILAARKEVEKSFKPTKPTKENEITPVIEPTQKEISPTRPALQMIKKAAAVTGSTALVGAGVVAGVLAPISLPLTFPIAVFAADSILYNINGVNGSMFEVDRKNRIKQRLNPLPVLLKHRGQKPNQIFEEETKKLFEGLEQGESYTTRSHAVTYSYLRRAEKQGLISDLSRKESGSSRLILENLVTGNWKAIINSKKNKMYDISFKMV